jgi:hypothetical protein
MILPELAEDIETHRYLMGTTKKTVEDAIKELDSTKMNYF